MAREELDGMALYGSRDRRRTAVPVLSGVLLALALIVGGCGGTDGGDGTDGADGQGSESDIGTGEAGGAAGSSNGEFPFVKRGTMFCCNGDDLSVELAITDLQRTDDYTVVYLDFTPRGEVPEGSSGAQLPSLIDPVNGRIYGPLLNGSREPYGARKARGDDVGWKDRTVRLRYYFPHLPDSANQVTFVGFGMGAMTGVPVRDAAEEKPAPEPNYERYADQPPPAGTPVIPPFERPDAEAREVRADMESFVDSDVASTTREGDTETIALHSDVMFAFDKADPKGEAAGVVRQPRARSDVTAARAPRSGSAGTPTVRAATPTTTPSRRSAHAPSIPC